MHRYRRLVWIGCLVAASMGIQASGNEYTQVKDSPEGRGIPARLNPEDKAQVIEYLRLKQMFGSEVWPGLDEAPVPLILYNDRFEFLIGHPDAPFPWEAVEGDMLQDHPYHRRTLEQSQAFAVPVGELWAASLNTFSHMAIAMQEELKENVPPEKLTPVLIKMMTPTPGQHVIYLLHEAFHAYQALRFSDRFQRTNALYSHEEQYPADDDGFKAAWNTEGSLLVSALREKDESERHALIRKFLLVRSRRRSEASLSSQLVDFERELEWLEGLAKYAEMRFAELGASDEKSTRFKDYRIVRNRTRADFYSRLNSLGELKGDLRFYLSGAAQAMLLDLISPEWKREMEHQPSHALEDLLRSDHFKPL